MALTPGTRLGVYEITAAIGEGGMGQVFRARDTKLDRDVAIKILPEAFAHDADRLARFTREARTLAALNHPHIAGIHGLEESPSTGSGQAGITALVMELVEGDDLSQRIARGAIPIDEALPIATQIADALEAAHEQGIIHRDLKPANIKVRPDGTVKVLDFGLAKALQDPTTSGPQDLVNSPTITTPAMTQAGMILGTAAYMAPEQAKGRAVDRRADIWAFGAVLYEMLTAHRAFGGEDVSDTLANVLRTAPAWERLPADVPARIRQVLRACLQRDAKQRLGDMQSVRLALDGAFETVAPQTVATTSSASGVRLVWMALAIVAVAGMAAMAVPALRYLREAPPPALHVTHTAITLPPDLPLSPTPIALSPDGQTLAMTAGNQIVLRRLDSTKLTPLPGTEGGNTPFFSPDGTWVGFVAAGELRRIRVDGTSRQTIGTLSSALSGPPAWGADDVIYFGSTGQGLFRVPATGGAPTLLTQPRREAGEITHAAPRLLDEGRTILFTLVRADGSVPALLTLATGEWRVIPGIHGGPARYAPSGHLLYLQGGTVFAVTMSRPDGTTTGTPEAQFDGVGGGFELSADGTLAYLPSSATQGDQGRIALVTRSGTVSTVVDDRVTPLVSASGGLRYSPGGGSIVAVLQAAGSDIWTYDLRRGARIKLTDQGPINTTPTWSPDGTQVAFNSTREPAGLYVQSLDAAGSAKLVLRRGAGGQAPGAWSRDGRTLVFAEANPRTGFDLWTLTLEGTATPLLVTPARERGPRLSPDGRWLIYQSDTARRDDVYVASFPTLGSTQLVSIGGGTAPRWAGEREIVYRRGRQVVSVPVTPGETLTLGRPTVLFEVDDVSDQYDVSPDGTMFVMLLRDGAGAGTAPGQVHLVLNLFEQLKRIVPTK